MMLNAIFGATVVLTYFVAPLGALLVVAYRARDPSISRISKMLLRGFAVLLSLFVLWMAFLLAQFVALNFPFRSGVIAHGYGPSGEEACVVQTFKGAEPYQVSLYARSPGQPWVWHYLAHQDNRRSECRIEFAADTLRVYRSDELRLNLSIAEATRVPNDSRYQLPAEYSTEQLLAHHNKYFRP